MAKPLDIAQRAEDQNRPFNTSNRWVYAKMGVIRKRLLFLPLLLSLLLVPTSASADFATGLAAYERGDYKTAFEEFKGRER